MALLQNDLTPVIPLQGSISASGDLSPLSYVAGIVTGNPDIYVQSASDIISAKQALEQLNIPPAILGPKEGLGLMNGTATSAAVEVLLCTKRIKSPCCRSSSPPWLWRHSWGLSRVTIPFSLKYAHVEAKRRLHGTYDIFCKVPGLHEAMMMTPDSLGAFSTKIDMLYAQLRNGSALRWKIFCLHTSRSQQN